MARKHLSLKQIGPCLGHTPNGKGEYTFTGQSFDPALEKVAKVYRRFPHQINLMLAERAIELEREESPSTLG